MVIWLILFQRFSNTFFLYLCKVFLSALCVTLRFQSGMNNDNNNNNNNSRMFNAWINDYPDNIDLLRLISYKAERGILKERKHGYCCNAMSNCKRVNSLSTCRYLQSYFQYVCMLSIGLDVLKTCQHKTRYALLRPQLEIPIRLKQLTHTHVYTHLYLYISKMS